MEFLLEMKIFDCHSCYLSRKFSVVVCLLFVGVKHLQLITFLDSEGRVTDSEAFRKRIFYGGLDHKLRIEVCVFIL